ncbi:hypothetical protein HAX54_041023 [Datura stramonium]|uniref:Uncharacterized protein n=1 Tax=Datura stramonium TaxID=4076 RepID=A0ABS8VNG6_DATST|nr:hypothetical protein [Datura stramonium]
MSHQVSDDCRSGRRPFDSEVNECHSGNGPSLTPSRLGSPALRVTEDLTDYQVSGGPSLRPSFRSIFWALLLKGDGGDDRPSDCLVIRLLRDRPSFGKMVHSLPRRFPISRSGFWISDNVGLLEVWTILLRDNPSFALFLGRLVTLIPLFFILLGFLKYSIIRKRSSGQVLGKPTAQ